MWLKKYNFGGGIGPGEKAGKSEEELRKLRQEFADILYYSGNNPRNRDATLTFYVTPDNPLYKEIWDPTKVIGYEREVMENYAPKGIYINEDQSTDYHYAFFDKRYKEPEPAPEPAPDPEMSKTNVNRLSPIKKERLDSKSPVLGYSPKRYYFRQHVNPYTNEKENISERQAHALQKAFREGKEAPIFDAPEAQDLLSGRYLSWDNPGDAEALHQFNMEYNPNYTGEEYIDTIENPIFKFLLKENLKNNPMKGGIGHQNYKPLDISRSYKYGGSVGGWLKNY